MKHLGSVWGSTFVAVGVLTLEYTHVPHRRKIKHAETQDKGGVHSLASNKSMRFLYEWIDPVGENYYGGQSVSVEIDCPFYAR